MGAVDGVIQILLQRGESLGQIGYYFGKGIAQAWKDSREDPRPVDTNSPAEERFPISRDTLQVSVVALNYFITAVSPAEPNPTYQKALDELNKLREGDQDD
jgi:hypothetical protein